MQLSPSQTSAISSGGGRASEASAEHSFESAHSGNTSGRSAHEKQGSLASADGAREYSNVVPDNGVVVQV